MSKLAEATAKGVLDCLNETANMIDSICCCIAQGAKV